MLPSIAVRLIGALAVAWSVAIAAAEAVTEAARRAQAEIDTESPVTSTASYNAKEISIDKAVPWS